MLTRDLFNYLITYLLTAAYTNDNNEAQPITPSKWTTSILFVGSNRNSMIKPVGSTLCSYKDDIT